MSASYYLLITAACLAVGILNFSSSSSSANLNCFVNVDMNKSAYDAFVATFPNTTTIEAVPPKDTSDPTATYIVRQPSSNTIQLITFFIGISYLSICGIALFMTMLVTCLANQLPEDFVNMGKCKRCMAMFCKILPILIVLIHWVILFLILGLWALVLTDACAYTTTNESGAIISPGKYLSDTQTLAIITSGIWGFLHLGASIVRDLYYIEPFIYWPYLGSSKVATFLCKTLGP